MVIINGERATMNISKKIKKILKNINGLNINLNETEIIYLGDGKTNESYLLNYENNKLVLRLNSKKYLKLGIDRKNELEILKTLKKTRIVPNIIYCDDSYEYLIYEYIEGSNLEVDKITKKDKNSLRDLIQIYQEIKVDLPKFDYFNHLSKYRDSLIKNKKIEFFKNNEINIFFDKLKKFQELDWSPKITHHDLISNVIRTKNGFKILDWEYAGNGHPSFDFCSLDLKKENNKFIRQLIKFTNDFWYQI